jgi:phenylacetic acid degradation operon negative regulatory protein
LLLLRILLIHEFRRILLKDPEIPDIMLPANWPGETARSLARDLYRRIAGPTTDWVNTELPVLDACLNCATAALEDRFA